MSEKLRSANDAHRSSYATVISQAKFSVRGGPAGFATMLMGTGLEELNE